MNRVGKTLLALLGVVLVIVVWKACSSGGDDTLPDSSARRAAPETEAQPPPPRLEGAPAPPPLEEELAADESASPEAPAASDGSTPTYFVEGRVLDAATKEGVPYVHVVGGWMTYYDMQVRQMERSVFESDADRDGHFRLEVTGKGTLSFFGLGAPGWRVFHWHVEGEKDSQTLACQPGRTTRVVLWAKATFRLQGTVEDEEGHPLEHVAIRTSVPTRTASGMHFRMNLAFTEADGRFDLGPFDVHPYVDQEESGRVSLARYTQVTVERDGWATLRFDPWKIPEPDRDRVRITMTRGITLAGVLVDERGRPVPDAVVAAECGADWELRRATRTDADGRWRLETVASKALVLRARDFSRDLKYAQEMEPTQDDLDMRLVAQRIRLSRDPSKAEALGLELVEVDDELRAAYDVPEYVHVMIWHPGEVPDALGIGRLEKGYGLWIVGEKKITSLEEGIEELLVQSEAAERSVRVVYTFWNEQMSGTNTQHVKLTEERLRALEDLSERLNR